MNARAAGQFGGGLAMAASLLAVGACQATKAAAPAAPPPLEVSVATVVEQRVITASEWIATLDGYVNAQIHPQVNGYLIKRNYREGAAVRQGDVLFEIDARPLNAVLMQVTAQMAQADAQLAKSARDVERDTPLAAQQAIAQSQLDAEVQAWKASEANLDALKAAVETARLNVSFTKVTSLISGVAAIATAQIGDLVGPATLLTTVSQVSPIKAYFAVSELEYLKMAGSINGTHGGEEPWDRRAGLSLTLSDGRTYPHKGTFVAADRGVDLGTGTIRLVAAFANPGNVLRPGQFGRVHAVTGSKDHALVVPQRAVTELQGGYQIRVLGPGNHVLVRTVTAGDLVGTLRVITSGVKPGDQVIVGAPTAVQDGSVVTPKPFVEKEG